jgi:uncharacterized protein YqjF (DUF2071 family)
MPGGPGGSAAAPPEPVTARPPRPVRWPLLAQRWRDVTFLHWPVDAGAAAAMLPPGTRADEFAGACYVGLVAFGAEDTSVLGSPPLPYLGTFPETNVRLYSVGRDGRRGVVFLSLDAARLLPSLAGRALPRLPYQWSLMRVRRLGGEVSYASQRRWPGPPARLRMRVRIGERVAEPSPLEHFLTARWGLHTAWYDGRTRYLRVAHPCWELYRAGLMSLAEDLVAATGLPAPAAGPVSVLYSPGVAVRAGVS